MSVKKIFESLKRLNEGTLSQEDKDSLEKLISRAMGEQCYSFEWNGDTVSFTWEVARDSDYEEGWPYQPDKPDIPGYRVSNYKVDGEIDDGMSTVEISFKIAKSNKVKDISDYSAMDKLRASYNTKTPVDILRQLASDGSKDIREYVASNPSTPVDILRQLASGEDPELRSRVALNSSTPADILRQLASEDDKSIRANVAGNSNAPADILTKLASDPNRYVRIKIAFNRNAPVEAFAKLVSDEDKDIRRNLADNPKVPNDVLDKLASDPFFAVRRNVAENPNTSVDTLRKLASDKDEWVKEYSLKNLKARGEK